MSIFGDTMFPIDVPRVKMSPQQERMKNLNTEVAIDRITFVKQVGRQGNAPCITFGGFIDSMTGRTPKINEMVRITVEYFEEDESNGK